VAGLHICEVALHGVDSRGEYVELANEGSEPVVLTGLELTDYTSTQRRPHIYRFPVLDDGSPFTLAPGQSAYVYTGPGKSELSAQGDWLLFAGRNAKVWNNSGDVAYLRRPNGELVDSRTAGHPKRHPTGH
jgi:Lamin Tail Domain